MNIKNHLLKRRLAKYHVRLSSPRQLDPKGIFQFEEHARLGDVTVDLTQSAMKKLHIGAYSYIRSGSKLLCVSQVGRYCSIGHNVTIGQNPRNHPIDWASTSTQFSRDYHRVVSPTTISHDVWIGDNAIIMSGLTIGQGAIVGCNAVVTKDVEPYQIVAGNPAKPIRHRFDNATIQRLLESQWWQFDKTELDKVNFEDVDNFHIQISKLTKPAMLKTIELHKAKIRRL